MAGEKVYSFTHSITETKLLALISANADDVQINIFVPEKKARQKQLSNGHANAPPLMLEAPTTTKPQAGAKTSGSVVVLQFLADHRTRAVSNTELNEHVEKSGHSIGAVSVAMSGFVKKGFVERVSSGHYKILKEGIARLKEIKKLRGRETKAPDTTDTKLKKPRKGIKKPGVGKGNNPRTGVGRKLIWAEIAKGEPVTPEQFAESLKNVGQSPKSVGTALRFYMSKGYLARLSPGVYQITQQGIDHHAATSN